LLVFGVFAGLNLRVLASDHAHPPKTGQDCSDHHDHHHPAEDLHSPHSDDCPTGGKHDGEGHHHHHGCCSPAQPLTIENDHLRQPYLPDSSLVGVRHDCEVPPDEPFLGSEKPPLI